MLKKRMAEDENEYESYSLASHVSYGGVVSLGGISDLVVDTIYTFLIFPLTISSNKVMNSGIY